MTKRIAITGGPNGGKTTALSVLKETFGNRIEVVPEAATMIFSGGFPRKDGSVEHVHAAQRIIFYATQQMESLAMQTTSAELIVCDRGTVDAAVYWPEGIDDFFAHMGTTLDEQIARYDAVIHLSPPLKAEFYQSTRVRTETLEEASRIDRKILKIWEKHPNRMVLPSMDHFFQKAGIIKDFIETLLPQEEKK